MSQSIQRRKAIIRGLLILLLAADVVLVAVNWKLNQSPHGATSELRRLDLLEKSYRADNARLQRFRTELPIDSKQWDEFFTSHFRPAGAGYSAISSDLGELSRSAGLHSDEISFRQHTPDARGLMEVEIATAVEGDYDNLLSFLNKLEHSDNFYVLDSLSLASASSGGKLRLNLQLRTYFRTT
jgi:hypothetical protein